MGRYEWSESSPSEIKDHSRAKHGVYRDYLRSFLRELNKAFGLDGFRINIVDGFAGGGLYVHGPDNQRYLGSPLILLSVLQEMQVELQARQEKPFVLDYRLHLVDADKGAIQLLNTVLRAEGHGHLIDDRVFLHNSSFRDALPSLLDDVRGRGSTIFILDQYGYKDVPFDLLRRIFGELRKPEIILTFDYERIDAFITDFDRVRRTLTKLGAGTLRRDEFDAAVRLPGGRPLLIQRMLHRAFLNIAKFYTPFFIRSRESNLAYWLLHLSAHPRARDVMTGLHWALHNHFSHFGGAGYDMLGFDPAQARAIDQPFMFDDDARTRAHWALREDVPSRIAAHLDGISFGEFFALNCNGSPADSQILREAVVDLSRDRIVRIVTSKGNTKRRPEALQMDDVLLLPPQKTLLLPSPKPVPIFARQKLREDVQVAVMPEAPAVEEQ